MGSPVFSLSPTFTEFVSPQKTLRIGGVPPLVCGQKSKKFRQNYPFTDGFREKVFGTFSKCAPDRGSTACLRCPVSRTPLILTGRSICCQHRRAEMRRVFKMIAFRIEMLIFIALMMMMMMVEQLEHTPPPFKCKIGYQVL